MGGEVGPAGRFAGGESVDVPGEVTEPAVAAGHGQGHGVGLVAGGLELLGLGHDDIGLMETVLDQDIVALVPGLSEAHPKPRAGGLVGQDGHAGRIGARRVVQSWVELAQLV